ncbi:hypothetical protein GGR50DRAFT_669172 [Xylaria sp. CBS 124048]|nr:hypothetical protein GGR50DRAFT_669172 [Xylaria sp. CBS 124048]
MLAIQHRLPFLPAQFTQALRIEIRLHQVTRPSLWTRQLRQRAQVRGKAGIKPTMGRMHLQQHPLIPPIQKPLQMRVRGAEVAVLVRLDTADHVARQSRMVVRDGEPGLHDSVVVAGGYEIEAGRIRVVRSDVNEMVGIVLRRRELRLHDQLVVRPAAEQGLDEIYPPDDPYAPVLGTHDLGPGVVVVRRGEGERGAAAVEDALETVGRQEEGLEVVGQAGFELVLELGDFVQKSPLFELAGLVGESPPVGVAVCYDFLDETWHL